MDYPILPPFPPSREATEAREAFAASPARAVLRAIESATTAPIRCAWCGEGFRWSGGGFLEAALPQRGGQRARAFVHQGPPLRCAEKVLRYVNRGGVFPREDP